MVFWRLRKVVLGESLFILTTFCSGDGIYADSLKLFIERFEFHGDPLDVALRRLLMDVGLPRETQQIDRVIQAFANKYLSCNPGIFTSRGAPYLPYVQIDDNDDTLFRSPIYLSFQPDHVAH